MELIFYEANEMLVKSEIFPHVRSIIPNVPTRQCDCAGFAIFAVAFELSVHIVLTFIFLFMIPVV